MDKSLTPGGWKAISAKYKVADKDLTRALVQLEGLDDDDFDGRIACVGKIATLATALKKDGADPAVAKYLGDMATAAAVEKRELAKARIAAEKLAAEEEDEDDEDDDEEEEEEEDDEDEEDASVEAYPKRLRAALDALKTAKEPFHFVLCIAKPLPAVMVSKRRIGAGGKKVLTKVTGGGKRFLKPGTVVREGKALVFDVQNPPAKFALLLRNSIQHFTGKKYRIRVGDEEVEGDPEELGGEAAPAAGPAAPAAPAAPPAAPKPALQTAPQVWSVTQRVVKSRIEQLKGAILEAFAGEGTDLVRKIEKDVKKLDAVFERLDDDLATILERTAASSDPRDRAQGVKLAKALLAEHVKFVKSEPMIAHIDANPFGVKTDLQGTLTKTLKHVAAAIGD